MPKKKTFMRNGENCGYLAKGDRVAPQVGFSKFVQRPSNRRYLPGLHSMLLRKAGQTSRISVFEVSINGRLF